MKALYLRVWLTVVAVLALFALGSGWLFQRQVEQERTRIEAQAADRLAAWGDLVQRSLPSADAPREEQAEALREWAGRIRVPMALDDAAGVRLATTPLFARIEADQRPDGAQARRIIVRLGDGRTLHLLRPALRSLRGPPGMAEGRPRHPGHAGHDEPQPGWLPTPPGWPRGVGLLLVLALLFVAVAAGAFPVVRRLTRRLEALQAGVERFGAGSLGHRVDAGGGDEVAAVAASFNRAAERIEALVRSNQSLLANASHELRSPLARLKMAISMLDDASPLQRERLQSEIHANIAELDQLVDEVLLASRIDAQVTVGDIERVDLLALALEEAAAMAVPVEPLPETTSEAAAAAATPLACTVDGNERLLRRALRNLLENARRYGGGADRVEVGLRDGRALLRVCDRGAGVPDAARERIFEPFYRLPGHAEREGGVGLGLSLVRQIALRHEGHARCEPRDGGGSCFVLDLPAA